MILLFSLITIIGGMRRHPTRKTWTGRNINTFPPCQRTCEKLHEQCKIKQYKPRLLFHCSKPPTCTTQVGQPHSGHGSSQQSRQTWTLRNYNRRPSCREKCKALGMYCVTIQRRPTVFGCDNPGRTNHQTTTSQMKTENNADVSVTNEDTPNDTKKDVSYDYYN